MRIVKSMEVLEQIVSNNMVHFYGAGKICTKILQFLELNALIKRVKSIYVTSLKNNAKHLNGVQVEKYCGKNSEGDAVLIVAVSSAHEQKKIQELLKNDIRTVYFISSTEFEKNLDAALRQLKYLSNKDKIRNYISDSQKLGKQENIRFYSFPYWDIYAPFSAVPSLVAQLKHDGYNVGQVDIGILCAHRRIKDRWQEIAYTCISEEFYDYNIKGYINNTYESYQEFLADMWFFKKDAFPVSEVKKSYSEMNPVQKRVVDAFYEALCNFDTVDFQFDQYHNFIDEMEGFVSSEFMEALVSEDILPIFHNIPKIIGISVTGTMQFLPACLFAKLIKDILPETIVIMGGSCADLFVNSSYSNKKDIEQFFDYIIVGEGETAISKLMAILTKHEGSIDDVPNLMHLTDQGKCIVPMPFVETVEALPCPDYDGLDLDLYFASETILPYQASRGCHYGNCAFCNHDEKYRHNYRTKSARKVVDEMIFLAKKYCVVNFQFVDEAIRPDCFEKIVDKMDQHNEFKQIHWFFYSRVSRQYNPQLVQKAAKNGCEMVMFGIESLNQRLLNFIKKGIRAETSKYCMKLFHSCGIKTYAWLMCNLPSETLKEARADLAEVKSLIEYFDAFHVGVFFLSRNTDMYSAPRKFNIISIDEKNAVRFVSHNAGKLINQDEMLHFFEEEYKRAQLNYFSVGNRYTLFFENRGKCSALKQHGKT